MSFRFELTARDGRARAGVFHTPRGPVETPVFMPVGTKATVKAMTPGEVKDLGASIVLSNTFHLWMRPGDEIVARLGGLHRFMNWHGPILTDSGGFQVWSLSKMRKINEEGAKFRSPIDGSPLHLTPEKAMAIQRNLGADIVMAFDECTEYPATLEHARASAERTLRWAERCRAAHAEGGPVGGGGMQALFGIVQGGVHPELRAWSATRTAELDFPGNAIGGLSVGETKAEMEASLETVDAILPEAKPRYLMGVGTPGDFFRGIERGVDMFDCVLPTRTARTGRLYTAEGVLNIRNAFHAVDPAPVSASCACDCCRNYSRAYLRHLFQCDEILGARLATTHNLFYFLDLMAKIRVALNAGPGRLAELKREALAAYAGT